MGYQIDQNGIIIWKASEKRKKNSKANGLKWLIVIGLLTIVFSLVVAVVFWPKESSLDRMYKMYIPEGFILEYDNGYSHRNYQDGNGGGIGIYYEGGGWGESVEDYLRKKKLEVDSFIPLQINWMDARRSKTETVDYVYNKYVIFSKHGIFLILFDYPIGEKSYYEGILDDVVYSFKDK